MVTDGGMETDLIFHHGVDLPLFAAFPLVDSPGGRSLLTGYHDLYTTTSQPMNVYSKFFAGRLGFRDEEAARASVALIDHYYRQFALAEDRDRARILLEHLGFRSDQIRRMLCG